MQSPPIRILVVEDDEALSSVLCEELAGAGHAPLPARTVAQARDALRDREFDVALTDLSLPDGSGVDLLRQISSEGLPIESIVLTGYATVQTALEAMKLGAYDYLTKPANMTEIDLLVRKAAEKAGLRRENEALRVRLQLHEAPAGLVTQDAAMQAVLATLDRLAQSELPVLIEGETGTGKELFARALHQRSPRARGPFVAVNCGAVPDNLIESELFGYERGAFTGAAIRKPGLFEVAQRGVLFLDEIADVSPAVQVKLLRVLEAREFYRLGSVRATPLDVRLVAAANKSLQELTRSGRFREDLYFRLNGATLKLPPLRERKADVPLLARHFLDRFAPQKKLDTAALKALQSHGWPGNVRELQMAVQRAAALSAGETIRPGDLPLDVADVPGGNEAAAKASLTLAEVEREHILSVLEQNGGHRGRTARALGIDPKTLYKKIGPAARSPKR
jgi:two-component system NtrC family response regulator/two-component system response regulator AtoC